MSKPLSIRKIIIEFNLNSLSYLRESMNCYHKYLKDVQTFEHQIPLSKGAIKRRIKYIEEFLEAIEVGENVEAI